MDDLIKALTIFRKHQNHPFPTHCEHDYLMVIGIAEKEVYWKDAEILCDLGFYWNDEFNCWASRFFGSA